jgi:hypothetical protein
MHAIPSLSLCKERKKERKKKPHNHPSICEIWILRWPRFVSSTSFILFSNLLTFLSIFNHFVVPLLLEGPPGPVIHVSLQFLHFVQIKMKYVNSLYKCMEVLFLFQCFVVYINITFAWGFLIMLLSKKMQRFLLLGWQKLLRIRLICKM